MVAFSTSISDDRNFIYIGGGFKGMGSLIKWSVTSKSTSWHHLIHDIIDPLFKTNKIDINQISQSFNRKNDTNHIAFCAKTERAPEIRALFVYIRENKFS
jgi:hypothetical protein